MKDKRIKTLNELKKYCEDISCRKDGVECLGDCEVYILVGGFGRSSKYIQHYSDGSWWINHQIDDTEEEYKNDKELKKGYPLLFEAIEKGCLIKY